MSRFVGNKQTLREKLKMLPKLANATDESGALLSIHTIVDRVVSSLTDAEKNILRERLGVSAELAASELRTAERRTKR